MICNRASGAVLGCVLLLQAGNLLRAQQPVELAVTPEKTLVLVSVQVSEIWQNEGAATLRSFVKDEKGVADLVAKMEKDFGLSLADVDRVVMAAWGSAASPQVFFAVSATKPLDRAKIVAALPGVEEQKLQDKSYFVKDGMQAMHFLNERTMIMGNVEVIKDVIKRPAKNGGALAAAMPAARQLAVGIQANELAKFVEGAAPPDLRAALKAQTATLAATIAKKKLTLDAQFHFADKDAAQEGEKAVRNALQLAAKSLPALIAQAANQKVGEDARALHGKMLTFLQDANTALQSPTVQLQGAEVNVNLIIETADPALSLLLMMPRAKINP